MDQLLVVVIGRKFQSSDTFRHIPETSPEDIQTELQNIVESEKTRAIVICVHRKSFSAINKFRRQFPILPFHHESGNEVYDSFLEKKRDYFRNHYIEFKKNSLLVSLTPLYLSLQAFWGITVDGAQDGIVKLAAIGNDANGDLSVDEIRQTLPSPADDIPERFLSLFPNSKAFLLVAEAQYDFYAPLFDMALSLDDKGEDGNGQSKRGLVMDSNTKDSQEGDLEAEAYECDTLCEILQELEDKGLDDIREAFGKGISSPWQASQLQTEKGPQTDAWFNIEISDKAYLPVSYDTFVSCFRELCALLANTVSEKRQRPQNKVKGYYGYKGNYSDLRDEILNPWKLADERSQHCKLATENDKESDHYILLQEQLRNWGIEKAMVVLGGIDGLNHTLNT